MDEPQVERDLFQLAELVGMVVANHRRVAPFGVAGGESAATGRNWIERATGEVEHFDATFEAQVAFGDIIVIETPGGGGFGEA